MTTGSIYQSKQSNSCTTRSDSIGAHLTIGSHGCQAIVSSRHSGVDTLVSGKMLFHIYIHQYFRRDKSTSSLAKASPSSIPNLSNSGGVDDDDDLVTVPSMQSISSIPEPTSNESDQEDGGDSSSSNSDEDYGHDDAEIVILDSDESDPVDQPKGSLPPTKSASLSVKQALTVSIPRSPPTDV